MMTTKEEEADLLRRAKEIWMNTRTLTKEADECVMKLMRHPDATPEQLLQAHRVCSGAAEEEKRLRKMLQKKWPHRSYLMTYPWNMEDK